MTEGHKSSGISENVFAPSACTGLLTSINQGIYACQEWVAHGSNAGPCIRVDFIKLKSNHPRGEKRATRDGWNQCLYERQRHGVQFVVIEVGTRQSQAERSKPGLCWQMPAEIGVRAMAGGQLASRPEGPAGRMMRLAASRPPTGVSS